MFRAFAYDDCDIPAEMTIAEFRASRTTRRSARPKVLARFRRRTLGRHGEHR